MGDNDHGGLPMQDAVRFFKDADLQKRTCYVVCDSIAGDNEATDDEIQSERRQLRGACPNEFRPANRDGDVGH